MSDEPIYCYCPEGGGLLHIHRNPPYDTEGRLELIRRKQEQRVVNKVTRLPGFEDDGLEPELPMSQNELERLKSASNYLEVCAIQMNHGDCENPGCSDESTHTRPATVLVGRHYFCDTCADELDRGKWPLSVEPRIKLEDLKTTEVKKCDFQCGRDAVMQFRRFHFCELCAEEILGSTGPFPRLGLEDVNTLPDCHQCGERAGVMKHQDQWYCAGCYKMLSDLETQDPEKL
jgi:hypothetical protein